MQLATDPGRQLAESAVKVEGGHALGAGQSDASRCVRFAVGNVGSHADPVDQHELVRARVATGSDVVVGKLAIGDAGNACKTVTREDFAVNALLANH